MDIEWVRRRLGAGMPVRAQSHPATDAWIFGDRFGDVATAGRTKIRVKMDRSGRVRTFHPADLEEVVMD